MRRKNKVPNTSSSTFSRRVVDVRHQGKHEGEFTEEGTIEYVRADVLMSLHTVVYDTLHRRASDLRPQQGGCGVSGRDHQADRGEGDHRGHGGGNQRGASMLFVRTCTHAAGLMPAVSMYSDRTHTYISMLA